MKNINKVVLFIVLTFAINIAMVLIFSILGGQFNAKSGTIMALAYMFVPLLSAWVVEYGIHRNKIVQNWNISFKINKWFFIGWFLFPVIGFATLGISLLFPAVEYSPEMTGIMERFEESFSSAQMEEMRESMEKIPFHPIWMTLIQGLIAGATINAIAAFGEEAGWRGFLLNEWKHMPFWKASLLIGLIWGIWHAPLILMGHNYPEHPQIGVLMMIIFCILLTPFFLYFTIKTKSVIAAAIMHGTLNGSVGIAIMVIEGGNDLTTGITGFPGFVALILGLMILFVYDRFIGKNNLMNNTIEANY